MATEGKNLSAFDPQSIPSAKGMKLGIVVSDWNHEITYKLRDGAKATMLEQGLDPASLKIVHVPGSFELALAAQLLIENERVDAVVALGSVIRGETAHFDFVCQATAQGIKDVSLKTGVPVIFGVLTDDNMQQAIDRSGGRHGNKGIEAAIAAIRMAAIRKELSDSWKY